MKKATLKTWVREVIPWGWRELLGFNFFSKKIASSKRTPVSVAQQSIQTSINGQVDMQIHSSKAAPFADDMENFVKEIHHDSEKRFLSGELLAPIIRQVEKNAAIIHCRIGYGEKQRQQHLVVIYPRQNNEKIFVQPAIHQA